MQTVSETYQTIAAGPHRVEVRVKIDRDDYPEGYWILQDNNLDPILTSSDASIEVAPFPSADLQEGQLYGVTISGGLFSTQSFTIGSCVSREIEVRFILGNAQIPRMAKIQPEVRLVNDAGGESEWIPKGTFWLDTRELDRTTGIMTIRGNDAMLKGDHEAIGGRVLASLDSGISTLTARVAKSGSEYERVENDMIRSSAVALNVTNHISREGDLDYTEAITNLKMLDYTNQATLSQAGKMYSSTLLNYMR